MRSITIVGGGIVGTSLAYHLRETSHDVTVLEKRQLGAGTTGKSIACFGWYPLSTGLEYELATRSWDTYGPLIERGALSYHENGLLAAAETDREREELQGSVTALRENGRPAEMLEPHEVTAYNVNPAVVGAGAAFYPSVGRLDPAELVSYFAEEARNDGVTIETDAQVTDVRVEGGAVTGLETNDGERGTDIVINAAGPWAPALNAMVELSLPLKHTFAPISVLETSENFDLPTVILESGLYFTGERSAKVLAGHAPHESSDDDLWAGALALDDPDSSQGIGIGSVGERHRELVAEEGPRVIPKLEGAEVSNEWRGIRCVTPDYRPMVGPTAVDGFYVATGMSGWGITLGPACGHLLAELLATGTVREGLEYLLPNRFSGAGHSAGSL